MVSIFSELNEKYRKKFIQLYEEFISNPNNEKLKEMADGMGMFGGSEFSEGIDRAACGAYKIEIGQMTIKEAKEILKMLKKEGQKD